LKKTIFFDAAGTLLHLPRGVGFHYALVARRHGVEWDERTLDRAFHLAWRAMPPPAASRAPRADDDRGWWRELVGRVLDSVAPNESFDRDAYFAALYRHFAEPGVWELYPEVKDVLGELRRRYQLGIVSNFDGRLRTLLSQFAILDYFEVFAISSEVGADKPDPFIFEQALKRAGISATEAVHAGDDPLDDWQGAAAAGIRCFQLERPKNSLLDLPEYLKTTWE